MLKGLIKYKFITILCLWSSLFPQDGKLAVSILDFTGEDVSDKLLRACYQKLETSLIESNRFTVIAKNQREQILEEMKFQSSGVCDEECAVEIGKMVGAEYLMLGDIIGFADLYQINIKIVNIEKGDIVEKVTKEIQGNLSDLLNGMAESSREITRRIVSGGGQVIPQQPGMAITQKKYGSIIIESTPSGATILIDNVKKGSTPLELKNIEVGTRKLKLIKTDYVTISKGIIINEETPANVSEVFILKTGNLSITSEPTGAMVYINGAVKGKTPVKIPELTIGDYNVTVSSENYHDKTERVIVEYDRMNSKNFILQPKPGTLTIIITPPEAKISVGHKQYKADADGLASIELPAGKHQINFSLNGYKLETKYVTLSANEKASLEVEMYLAKTEEKHPPPSSPARVKAKKNYGNYDSFNSFSKIGMFTRKAKKGKLKLRLGYGSLDYNSRFDDEGVIEKIVADSIADIWYYSSRTVAFIEYGLSHSFSIFTVVPYEESYETIEFRPDYYWLDEYWPERDGVNGLGDIELGLLYEPPSLFTFLRFRIGVQWKSNTGTAYDKLEPSNLFPTGSGQNDIEYFIDSDMKITQSTLFSFAYLYSINYEGDYTGDSLISEGGYEINETYNYKEKPGNGMYYTLKISKQIYDLLFFGIELMGGEKGNRTLDGELIDNTGYEFLRAGPIIGIGNINGFRIYSYKTISGVNASKRSVWGLTLEYNF
jgi:hypothetical protein